MTCPICQKVGLPDEAIKCPQCNSDLSQFHLLSRIENTFSNWKKLKIIFGVVFLILIVVISISLISSNGNKINNSISVEAKQISDSTSFYRKKYFAAVNKIDSLTEEKAKPILIDYKVRYGDNLSTIANFFYGDMSKYQLIADRNNLSIPYTIYVNQILKVEISK